MWASGRPMSLSSRLKTSRARGVNSFTWSVAVEEDRADVGRVDEVLEVVVGERQLVDLDFQLLVDGRQLLVDRLKFLLAGLELLGCRAQLLVHRLELFVRRLRFLDLTLVLLDRCMQLLPRAFQLFFELPDRRLGGTRQPDWSTVPAVRPTRPARSRISRNPRGGSPSRRRVGRRSTHGRRLCPAGCRGPRRSFGREPPDGAPCGGRLGAQGAPASAGLGTVRRPERPGSVPPNRRCARPGNPR